eukprot:1379222-Amphidinium_carterae.2
MSPSHLNRRYAVLAQLINLAPSLLHSVNVLGEHPVNLVQASPVAGILSTRLRGIIEQVEAMDGEVGTHASPLFGNRYAIRYLAEQQDSEQLKPYTYPRMCKGVPAQVARSHRTSSTDAHR